VFCFHPQPVPFPLNPAGKTPKDQVARPLGLFLASCFRALAALSPVPLGKAHYMCFFVRRKGIFTYSKAQKPSPDISPLGAFGVDLMAVGRCWEAVERLA
jgi:hypothetical protein